jgi:hypothetical protein
LDAIAPAEPPSIEEAELEEVTYEFEPESPPPEEGEAVIFRGCPSLGLWTISRIDGTSATITRANITYTTRLDRLEAEPEFAEAG